MSQLVETFFDDATYTLTYVVYDEATKDALIIDPVLDYDPASSAAATDSIDKVLNFIESKELKVHLILETHAHADHLTGALELKKHIPNAKVGIGESIIKVQEIFKGIFNLKDISTDGTQFDLLLNEKEPVRAGSIEVKTIHTPGHTPACSSYLIGNRLFTGDALFMPDSGTGRCDFPAGSAEDLYNSVHEKIYALPDDIEFYTGHDYQPGGRELKYKARLGESKTQNIQLKSETTKEDFIKFRTQRDSTLNAPRLLLPSIQINIEAGHLPKAEDNGVSYIKLPITMK